MEYAKLGIRFQYPANWRLDQADALAGRRSVTVYSPTGGSFWSVSLHPRSVEPVRLAQAAAAALKEEYDSLEAEWIEETLDQRDLVGYDFNFFCFDLTSSAAVRSLRTHRATYTVFWQAEDRELDQFLAVFRAMTQSLLNGLGTEKKPT